MFWNDVSKLGEPTLLHLVAENPNICKLSGFPMVFANAMMFLQHTGGDSMIKKFMQAKDDKGNNCVHIAVKENNIDFIKFVFEMKKDNEVFL